MMWSIRSSRQLSIHRSATPFCQGLWNEVRTARMAIDRTAMGTSKPYLASRSKMRSRSRVIGESLPQLLNNPSAGGIPSDIKVQDSPTIVTDDEETVEHTELDRGNREEVHRGDRFSVISKKGKPAFCWLRVSRSSFHPAGNRSFRDIETEHEKFAVDARCAPGGILCHHAKDQIANFFRNPFPADPPAGFGDRTPIECKPRSLPTDHGLGTDDHLGLFPFGPKPSRHDPEHLIERR